MKLTNNRYNVRITRETVLYRNRRTFQCVILTFQCYQMWKKKCVISFSLFEIWSSFLEQSHSKSLCPVSILYNSKYCKIPEYRHFCNMFECLEKGEIFILRTNVLASWYHDVLIPFNFLFNFFLTFRFESNPILSLFLKGSNEPTSSQTFFQTLENSILLFSFVYNPNRKSHSSFFTT